MSAAPDPLQPLGNVCSGGPQPQLFEAIHRSTRMRVGVACSSVYIPTLLINSNSLI
jgi:hypothetical protein